MSTKFEDLILRDETGNRPAAGVPGRLFYDTTLEKWQRDTGADWEDCEPDAGGVGDMTKAEYDTDDDGTVDSADHAATADSATEADAIDGVDAAGNSKYYGTDSGGTPGFYDLPEGGEGGADILAVQVFS